MSNVQRIGFVAIFFLFFACFQTCFADPALPTPVGRVVWVKGTIKAVMQNNEQRILQKMSVIYLHDTLITDEQSQAQIVFTDGTLMSFYPSTKFIIDQYAYKPNAKKSIGKSIMSLIAGGFRTITGLIAKKNPSDYQVNTPVATIGVRGTDYGVYIKNNQVFMVVYSGNPCIAAKNKPDNRMCLDNKLKYAYVAGSDVAPVALTQQPDVFKEKLDIILMTIAPFESPSSGKSNSGTISSFCITQ